MSIPLEKRMNLADGKLLYDNLRTHLNDKIDSSEKGSANGVAELDSTGKILSSQLPSYVDDVRSFNSLSDFPATGEDGIIYVAKDTNITYRWGGSNYIAIGSDLALGETASTAYRGDRGKIAYDHASAKGSAYASGLYKITTNVEGHVTGATAVQKRDITVLGIPDNADLSDVRDRIGDVVAIQNEEPTEEDTKIWISGTSGTAYQVPTYQEFQEALENLPTGSVEDVQINGTSILDNGVANIPVAGSTELGVVAIGAGNMGIGYNASKQPYITSANSTQIKAGNALYRPIIPYTQHESTFYGLAKAAGADEKNSSLTVGTYTPEAQGSIQKMLGVSNMLAPIEEDASASSQAYAVGQVFAYNGKLYKATSAIALGGIIAPGTNCEETTFEDSKVSKENPVFTGSISLGRKDGTVIGQNSVAIGMDVEANGMASYAEGYHTISGIMGHSEGLSTVSAVMSHAEGQYSFAGGNSAHAEGIMTAAIGSGAHAEGSSGGSNSYYLTKTANSKTYVVSPWTNVDESKIGMAVIYKDRYGYILSFNDNDHTITLSSSLSYDLNNERCMFVAGYASGANSHIEGYGTVANSGLTHASGRYNKFQNIFADWVSETAYEVGDKVIKNYAGYECIIANNDSTFDQSKWRLIYTTSDTAFVIGNGVDHANRSNALMVDWSGTGHFAGDIYVGCNPDSTGGTKLHNVEVVRLA